MQDFGRFIEQLKEKNDIADVVSKYVTLERRGGKLWGRCPFHSEKTASFTVNTDGQYYHCFGCGAGGDVIRFIREIETLDFMEAAKLLCERSGMEMPNGFADGADRQTQEEKKRRDRLYALLKAAARYYFECLKSKGDKVLSYLIKRGVSEEYIGKFGLGYAPDYYGLIKHLQGLGYTSEEMIAAGVAVSNKGRESDPLGTRLIVPIINVNGDVIAFGGRDMENSSPAKYKNTSETPLFLKSKNLYAINLVKKSKQKGEGLIVVEGYMDAIALHQAGFSNTVASMGTSLTREQAKLIKRFSDEVYICYDGDSAGKTATLRGLDILKEAGLSVKVISMPEDTDPDEYIKEKGAESYRKLLDNAPPLADFKLNVLSERYNINTADGRRKYSMAAIKIISQEESRIVREELLKQLRDRTSLTYESLKRELESTAREETVEKPLPTGAGTSGASLSVKAIRFMLYCLLKNKSYAKLEDIDEVQLTEEEHIKIYRYICERKKNGGEIAVSSLFADGGSGETASIAECGEGMKEEESRQYYNDCARELKSAKQEERLKILTAEYEIEKDIERRKALVLEIQALTMEQKKGT